MSNSLKDRRKELGFTLRDVEEISKGAISNAYLSQLENGRIKNPSISVALQLAATYAVPLDTVCEWIGTPAIIQPIEICPTCGQAVRS